MKSSRRTARKQSCGARRDTRRGSHGCGRGGQLTMSTASPRRCSSCSTVLLDRPSDSRVSCAPACHHHLRARAPGQRLIRVRLTHRVLPRSQVNVAVEPAQSSHGSLLRRRERQLRAGFWLHGGCTLCLALVRVGLFCCTWPCSPCVVGVSGRKGAGGRPSHCARAHGMRPLLS